jgi:hypothetical protein
MRLVLDRDSRSLPLRVSGGNCYDADGDGHVDAPRRQLDHVDVAESARTVTVGAWLYPDNNHSCFLNGVYFTHIVALDRPLGNRSVVDEHTGQSLAPASARELLKRMKIRPRSDP